jgi:hypothetical protein
VSGGSCRTIWFSVGFIVGICGFVDIITPNSSGVSSVAGGLTGVVSCDAGGLVGIVSWWLCGSGSSAAGDLRGVVSCDTGGLVGTGDWRLRGTLQLLEV